VSKFSVCSVIAQKKATREETAGQLAGKCALVTNGARELGLAIAKACEAEGDQVAITDRLEAEGARGAVSLDGDAAFLSQDVTNSDEWNRALDQAVAAAIAFIASHPAMTGSDLVVVGGAAD
jgi:NAD(P)-dependent dehydrogenase (short-subunit alcohol dehydrogenase family)